MNGHVIVVDLGYGDAGKGTIVDWLCARSARDAQDASGSELCAAGLAHQAHQALGVDLRFAMEFDVQYRMLAIDGFDAEFFGGGF